MTETAREMVKREAEEARLLSVECEHGPCKCERARLNEGPHFQCGIWDIQIEKQLYGWPSRVRP